MILRSNAGRHRILKRIISTRPGGVSETKRPMKKQQPKYKCNIVLNYMNIGNNYLTLKKYMFDQLSTYLIYINIYLILILFLFFYLILLEFIY